MKDSNILCINSILTQLKNLNEQYEKHVRKKGEEFNVFSIIGREHYEVQIHSAIIAELLNPDGLHGQGNVFLKHFLNLKKLVGEFSEILKCERIQVSKEFSILNNTGRIDILIQANNTSIAIENKINAPDHEKQLERYYGYTKYPVIYLTLDGSKPVEYTLGDLPADKVMCLSYADDIVEWLDSCIKEVPRLPQIRETLYQYQILVKSLTGQSIDREYDMKKADIFFEGENYKIIPTLEKSILEFKVQLQMKFWEALINQMKEKHYTSYTDANNKSIEKFIRSYYDSKSQRTDYGIIVHPCSEQQPEYVVKVEISYFGYVYWGFAQFENNEQNLSRIDNIQEAVKNILKEYQHDSREVGESDGWYGYIYPTYNNLKYDFSFCDEKSLVFIQMMTNEIDRKEFIDDLANNIKDAINKFQTIIVTNKV